MNTDGAAVDHTPRATGFGCVDHRAYRLGVYRAVFVVAKASLPIDRGNVVNDLDALGSALERRCVSQITGNDFNARKICGDVGTGLPNECEYVIAAGGERASEVTTCESGCAGD
jgi:hypothetical protein